MADTVKIGSTTYSYSEVKATFPGWNDRVGENLSQNAKNYTDRFNYVQEKLWSKLKKVGSVNEQDFKYDSMESQIRSLGVD